MFSLDVSIIISLNLSAEVFTSVICNAIDCIAFTVSPMMVMMLLNIEHCYVSVDDRGLARRIVL